MVSQKNISFNEAWKDFLIIRAIPYKLRLMILFDSNRKVTSISTPTLNWRVIEEQRYFCDESTIPDMPICYPENVVLSEIKSKIVKPLMGRQLGKSEIASLKGKSQKIMQDIEAQLGCSIKNEVKKLVSDGNYWEASFSLHQILEHRLRKLLMFKCVEIDYSNQKISIDRYKEKICEEEIITFRHLTKLAFLVRAIDKETREGILRFNSERCNIAHKLLKMKIPKHVLKNLCLRGLELIDALESCFSEIIRKPQFLKMQKFEIPNI